MNSHAEWVVRTNVDGLPVADLGGYDINGSVESILGGKWWGTSFDLAPGPGVDVVIEAGVIPEEHREFYNTVTCVGVLPVCVDKDALKAEIVGLLAPGGKLILTTCDPGCGDIHSTIGVRGKVSMNWAELREWLMPEIECCVVFTIHGEHPDLVYIGRKR